MEESLRALETIWLGIKACGPAIRAQLSQSTAAPTMAMSLEQPLTEDAAPMEEVTGRTAMHVTPDQAGEHAAEITPNAALAVPIGELTINTDAETIVPSPARRASVSDASPPRKYHLEAGTSPPLSEFPT